MQKLGTISFLGKSGHHYNFAAYPLGVKLKKGFGGVYFITARSDDGGSHHSHHKVYLGETGDLSELSEDHPKQSAFEAEGANCICIHATKDPAARERILADLLAHYSPACNE